MNHINPNASRKVRSQSVPDLFLDLRNGSISALSKAITLIESAHKKDEHRASELLRLALPFSGNSFRLGLTGVPGVGKSTFIESFGSLLLKQEFKIAVLAIDPSSNISGGSILGDKTRMEELVKSSHAFIRPSPAGKTLGGVARKTREAILLCEAAGFNFIIIETVGVGQSETAIHSMTDFFLLLKIAGTGDDLQGIKRGIMEMADAIVINKADGDNSKHARRAQREFSNAVNVFQNKKHQQKVKVYTASGIDGTGLPQILQDIQGFKTATISNGSFLQRRIDQELYWLHQTIEDQLKSRFYGEPGMVDKLAQIEKQVQGGSMSAYEAASLLLSFKK
ncbi:MAG: methylmalonyl Co-A mutase-associated GTPase MeaB [Nonlabens sp.]